MRNLCVLQCLLLADRKAFAKCIEPESGSHLATDFTDRWLGANVGVN